LYDPLNPADLFLLYSSLCIFAFIIVLKISSPSLAITGQDKPQRLSEIIGTWNSGIWYWDEGESKLTQMTDDTLDGDIAAGDFTGDGIADVAST